MNVSRVLKPMNGINSLCNSFKPVTHVIFDMDGLLLDTESLYKSVFASIISSYGKEYTPEVRLAVLGTKECDTSRIICEKLQLPLTPDEFTTKSKAELRKVMGSVPLMKGADSLVRHLHKNNIPIAVATSSSQDSFDLKTSKHKSLFSLFSHIVCGSTDPEVVHGKPAPDIFLIAAQRFKDNPDPSCCLVFEDAPNGVDGAKSAGMQVVMVPEDYIPLEKKTHATLVLESLEEFKPDLFGLPPFEC